MLDGLFLRSALGRTFFIWRYRRIRKTFHPPVRGWWVMNRCSVHGTQISNQPYRRIVFGGVAEGPGFLISAAEEYGRVLTHTQDSFFVRTRQSFHTEGKGITQPAAYLSWRARGGAGPPAGVRGRYRANANGRDGDCAPSRSRGGSRVPFLFWPIARS